VSKNGNDFPEVLAREVQKTARVSRSSFTNAGRAIAVVVVADIQSAIRIPDSRSHDGSLDADANLREIEIN